jgi:hypothetical protein
MPLKAVLLCAQVLRLWLLMTKVMTLLFWQKHGRVTIEAMYPLFSFLCLLYVAVRYNT